MSLFIKSIKKFNRKNILPLCVCTILIPSMLSGCGISPESNKFDRYLDNLFKSEVCSNTLNLHYTLSSPSDYGISDYKITFGDLSKDARSKNADSLRQAKKDLKRFHRFLLSDEQKLNYDLLSNYIDSQLAMCDFDLYDDMLSPSNGLQSQLPVLFAEYKFRSEADVVDYLQLLKQLDSYYTDIVAFEGEKSDAGLFMNDSLCLDVIKECEAFIKDPEKNYLLSTFEAKINEMDEISPSDKDKYIKENQEIIEAHVIPAYQILIKGLTSLLGTGENDDGLCDYDSGKGYYASLVKMSTGSDDSIENLDQRIKEKREADLAVCTEIKEKIPDIAEKSSNIDWNYEDEEEMIAVLQKSLLKEFPKMPDTSYEISDVDKSLSDSLAPAFYITAPIDNYDENTIYINSASEYPDIYYFTTLAHEGYPGHLYQTVMSYHYGMAPFRSLLDYGGFTEGWATYVEMLSYYHAGLDEDVASFLQHSEAATLSLYASSDIGIHYHGWDRKQLYDFWKEYGFTDEDMIDRVRELILADPGNYLKYYVGYLEFEQLREEKETEYGKKFDPVKFHKAILKIGPAPFDIIDKYFDEYYKQS